MILMLFVVVSIGCPTGSFASCTISRSTVPAAGTQELILTVTDPGRFALRVESSSGASIQLVDPISGPGLTAGTPGEQDGRLDTFLDEGKYLILVEGPGLSGEEVRIFANPFLTGDWDVIALPGLETQEFQFNDLETRDFWFSIPESKLIYIDSAGRALADMRLWQNGTWLTGDEPERTVIESIPGRPMNRCRLMVTCPAGTHKVTFYGGQPLVWAAGGEENPLYIRSGLNTMTPAGSIDFTVGIFGDEWFYVDSGPDYFVLESLVIGTGLAVEEIESDDDITLTTPSSSAIFNRNFPRVERQFSNTDSSKLVRVSGQKGAFFNLRWFAVSYNNPERKTLDGTHSVTFFSAGNPRDFPELNALIIEETRQKPPQEKVLASSTIEAGPGTPVYRRFNVNYPVSLFVSFKTDGNYRISGGGTPGRFILEPFFLRNPENYTPPLPQAFNSSVSVGARLYRLTIQPDKPGSFDLAITQGDAQADWSQLDSASTGSDGAVRFRDLTFSKQMQYHFVTNQTGLKTGCHVGEALESGNPLQASFEPDPSEKALPQSQDSDVPSLVSGKSCMVNKEQDVAGRVKLIIREKGVYDLTAKSIFPTVLTLRSVYRIDLGGYTPAGSSNSSILRQSLTPGNYYLDVDAVAEGSGPVTVSCTALNVAPAGEMKAGDVCRSEIQPFLLSSVKFTVTESGRYFFRSRTLETPVMLRLENADGWPMAVEDDGIQEIELMPGQYQLVQIASPFTRAVKLETGKLDPQPAFRGEGPHALNLAMPANGLWEHREPEQPGDTWMFPLQAETELTISLSNGMQGKLIDPVTDDTVALIPDKSLWKGNMLPGDWELVVSAAMPDNLKPYTITASTEPLVDGASVKLVAPDKVSLRIGGLEPCFTLISVEATVDTRAVLVDQNSCTVASSDDVPGDWNPSFAMWMLPGDYTLFIELVGISAPDAEGRMQIPVSSSGPEVVVAMRIPVVTDAEWPETGPLIVRPHREVAYVSSKSAEDYLAVISATSEGLSGMAGMPGPEPVCGDGGNGKPGRNHMFFSSAGSPDGCLVWNLDGRMDPVTLNRIDIPIKSIKHPGNQTLPVNWSEKFMDGTRVAAAWVHVDTPGSFRIFGSDNNIPILVSADSGPFVEILDSARVVAAGTGLILAYSGSADAVLPNVTIDRVVLNGVTPVAEWQADRDRRFGWICP